MAELLLGGLAIGESPRWHDDRLWFSNWGTGEVLAVGADGKSELMASVPPETLPFSIDWLPDGRLLVVAGARLLRQENDGTLVEHADLSEVADLCNEIVVDRRGNVFVNGGSFDFSKPSVVLVVTPDGQVRQVAEGILFANGMAVTEDGTTLIVAESHGCRLSAFDIGDGGELSNRRVWADLGEGNHPDGICLDAEGAVWYADVPNQHCVRVREGGEVLQTVKLDRGAFACMLGGDDGRTLYILAAEWAGFENMFSPARTGQLLTHPAAAPHAGRP
ncbi:sugar lactone lactonase YvrE [Kribbella voronezhensis]|uniref:Sugar lactone lactonase YvrE n=1 Tax=Kribbella voronezhensis TaxID=2512212 RepID=A0A4R7SVM8_9ACTN|nr:SMP-30/gluconolactonase/LRE family protein [Kribbella voronezhensis]TDU82447.1 sugar lactone lactonase YvrE [Kribbella voronezhensis]